MHKRGGAVTALISVIAVAWPALALVVVSSAHPAVSSCTDALAVSMAVACGSLAKSVALSKGYVLRAVPMSPAVLLLPHHTYATLTHHPLIHAFAFAAQRS